MSLTEQETQLYDRQIRLWGSDTQMKLRQSHILLLNFDQVGADLAKNLALSGTNLHIYDPTFITPTDVSQVFFYREEDIGRTKQEVAIRELREMNSMVEIRVANNLLTMELESVNCVCVCNGRIQDAMAINAECRRRKVPFYFIVSINSRGLFFNDLGEEYTYRMNKGKEMCTVNYKPIAEVRSLRSELTELSPTYHPCVSAVLAGVVSQDIVKVISGVGEPVRNFFVYDMFTGNGVVETAL